MQVSKYFFTPLCPAIAVPVSHDICGRLAQILGCETACFDISVRPLGDEHGGDMVVSLKRAVDKTDRGNLSQARHAFAWEINPGEPQLPKFC